MYAPERLYEEVAYVAYHFHWSHDEVMNLDHGERTRFVQEIGRINKRLTDEAERQLKDRGW